MSLTPRDAYGLALTLSRAVVEGVGDRDELRQTLDGLSGREWVVLDQAARTFRYQYETPISGVRGWLDERLNEPDGFVAAVTSMHADGRFRERAARALRGVGGPLAATTLAIRLIDHVPQVRQAAAESLQRADMAEHLESVMDVVLAGRDRRFGLVAVQTIESKLRAEVGREALIEALLGSSLRRVRRRGVELAHQSGLISVERLHEIARTETDQLILAWCADWLLASRDAAGLADLLDSRSAMIRQVVVLAAEDDALSDDRLLALAVDRVPRVRESARFRARKRGLDVAGWYRAQLQEDLPGNASFTNDLGRDPGRRLGRAPCGRRRDRPVELRRSPGQLASARP